MGHNDTIALTEQRLAAAGRTLTPAEAATADGAEHHTVPACELSPLADGGQR